VCAATTARVVAVRRRREEIAAGISPLSTTAVSAALMTTSVERDAKMEVTNTDVLREVTFHPLIK